MTDDLHEEAVRAGRWAASSVLIAIMANLTARMAWSQVSQETKDWVDLLRADIRKVGSDA